VYLGKRIWIAQTLLIEGVSRCPTPTLMITLNYVIFSKVRVSVVFGVRVYVCAS